MSMNKLIFFSALIGVLVPNLMMANITAPCTSVPGNLIVNCGFETGNFSGWTTVGNFGATGVSGTFGGIAPNSGNYQAYLGPVGSDGFLSQTFVTTPGAQYQVSLYEAGFGGAPSNFGVIFDGTTLLYQNPAPNQQYTLYSFLANATGATSTLEIEFRNDPSYQLLDDVSVTQTTPEPGLYSLLGLGLAAMGAVVKRRRNTA